METTNSTVHGLTESQTEIDNRHYDQEYLFPEECKSLSASFFAAVKIIILLLSLILNSCIIAAVASTNGLYTAPHVTTASLAVSDLINALVIGSFQLVAIHACLQKQSHYNVGCVAIFFRLFSAIANLANHFTISIERWLYIARPFVHQRIVTPRSTVCVLAFMWVLPILVNLNVLGDKCGFRSFSSSVNVILLCPTLYFSLSCVMFSIYFHITCIARRQLQLINKTRPLGFPMGVKAVNTAWTSAKSAWKSVRLLVIVFGTFFLLRTPVVCAEIYTYVSDEDFYHSVPGSIIDLIWFFDFCANFVILIARDNVFRSVLKKRLFKVGCESYQKRVSPENRTV